MRYRKKSLLTLLMVFWTMITLVVWRCSPAITLAAGTSLHAIAGQWLHGLMLGGLAVFVLWLGRLSINHHYNLGQTLALLVKLWLLMILTGVLVTLSLTFRDHFQVTDLYTVLFPVLRNEVPIISGVFLGLVASTLTFSFNDQQQRLLRATLYGLLIIPFVFGNNMFRLNGLQNPLLFMILFWLGTIKLRSRKPLFNLLVTGIICLLLMGMMPYISVLNHGDLSTAGRFTTVANPFLVLAASSFVDLLTTDKNDGQLTGFTWGTIVAALTLVSAPSMVQELKSDLLRHAGHSTIKLLTLGLTASIVLLLVSVVWTWIISRIAKQGSCLSKIDHYFATLSDLQHLKGWLNNKKNQLFTGIRHHRAVLITAFIAYLMAFLSMLLMNTSWKITPNVGQSFNIVMLTFFQRQTMVILNAIFIFALTMFIWAIVRRYYVALVSSTFLIAIWIVASRMKVLARNEPIMPSELKMVSVWGSLIGMAGPLVLILAGIALVVAVVLIIYFERHDRQPGLTAKSTLASLIILPALLVSSLGWNHPHSALDTLMRGLGDDPMFYNQLSGARVNGPIIQFLNNLDVTVMTKPGVFSSRHDED